MPSELQFITVGKWVEISNVTYKSPVQEQLLHHSWNSRPALTVCTHTLHWASKHVSLVLKIRVFVLCLAVREKCQCCDRRIHSVQAFVLFTDSMMGMNGHSLKRTGVGFQVSSTKLSDIQQRTLAAARRGDDSPQAQERTLMTRYTEKD